MRVLIVAENVSMRMGGEASLPFYYFQLMAQRGHDVWLACHARVRDELDAYFSSSPARKRIYFVEDTRIQAVLWRLGRFLPYRIRDLVVGQWIHVSTMRRLRRLAKRLVAEHSIDVILEPAPITPKGVSFLYRMGAPVAIGPLCGGLDFPPAFRDMDSRLTRLTIYLSRAASSLVHAMVPGKLMADALLVANKRTADALPAGGRGRVYQVVESGVDLAIWRPVGNRSFTPGRPPKFVYSGRLVDWKGVEFLLAAFREVAAKLDVSLHIIGDGELREQLTSRVREWALEGRVTFHGWQTRPASAALMADCHVFVLPSLRECGGTVILEALAMGLPVIATRWGGPGEYVNESCGILVEPASKEAFVSGLTEAMRRLAESPELCRRLGLGGRERVRTTYFDWESKTDRVVEILQEVVTRAERRRGLRRARRADRRPESAPGSVGAERNQRDQP
jgi:glycosyltransferase involved in cell wall biosynthesis